MNYVITGATGLLGRHFIFEAIKNNLHRLDCIRFTVLGRGSGAEMLHTRIKNILVGDGAEYIFGPRSRGEFLAEFVDQQVRCVNLDLIRPDLGMNAASVGILRSWGPIDHFIHAAAFLSFTDTPDSRQMLQRINVFGTANIMNLAWALGAREFDYVGTSYSCGMTAGRIHPSYFNPGRFRNPYEQSRQRAEAVVRTFAKKQNIRYRCFRPSTISGQLIEAPLGKTSKFGSFYAWAAFFLRQKIGLLPFEADPFPPAVRFKLRCARNGDAGTNIVPVDYAAKMMYAVCSQDVPGHGFHLVNDQETRYDRYLPWLLESLNVKGVEMVDQTPDALSPSEKIYYGTAGRAFTPYLLSEPMQFDTSNLSELQKITGLQCPPINRASFNALMRYARRQRFGILTGIQELDSAMLA